MKNDLPEQRSGYLETIQRGVRRVRTFTPEISEGQGSRSEQTDRLIYELDKADAVVVGAGAGLSTSAGFTYSGARFQKYFFDFSQKYGFDDMYSGGFYPYPTKEEFWGFWCRNIYVNRYMDIPKPVYSDLRKLLTDKDHFVITTNVDHCFQRAGFDKERLFYTQGDYGLFQSTDPANRKTYDNEEWTKQAVASEGFIPDERGLFQVPPGGRLKMTVPADMIPKCPDDGSDAALNLRSDDTFVEDEGWHRASAAYAAYLDRFEGAHILFLELGVGANTPVIIKYPFWQMTADNPNAVYACLNYGEAFCPAEIASRSLCINGDIGEILSGIAAKGKTAD